MPPLVIRTHSAGGDFGPLRAEFVLPESFGPDVLAEAEAAVLDPLASAGAREDATDLPFVTIDPPGAKDLDQAMVIERTAGGFRVHYAIADLAAFVPPGGALDREARLRGQTLYLPDGNVPLHPPVLSEGAASLLPGEIRPAVLWTIETDEAGEPTATRVRRALVRSTEQFDYETVQAQLEAGNPHPSVAALPELGKRRRELAVRRGAVELQLPEQEISGNADSGWVLARRPRTAVDAWNAEISLLTGMAAADLMLRGGVGLLRTMPAPKPEAVAKLRAAAESLGVAWPGGASVGAVVALVDPGTPRGAAFLDQAADLLRGAAYTAFDGPPPAVTGHGGVGAPYAHVTAPLRRLADRYATEACLALTDGRPVPPWVRDALPRLPKAMADTDRLAGAATRGAIDLAEAVLLQHRVGDVFDAGVLDCDDPSATRPPGGTVALDDPAVRARCQGILPLGDRITARLTVADPTTRKVLFERA